MQVNSVEKMQESHNLQFLKPYLKPLPHKKILDWSKLNAVAVDNLNVAQIMTSLFDLVKTTVDKGGNGCYQHFLLFQQFFQMPSLSRLSKVGTEW